MKKLKAVIFDMDGVLFDTERVYMKRLNRFMKHDGKQIDLHMQMILLGSSDQEKWNYIKTLYDNRISKEQFFQRYDTFYQKEPFSYQAIIFDEVKETLSALYKQGYQLALASSSLTSEINSALNECHLAHYFTSILSGEQCVKTKPDPQIYLDTLERLSFDAKECIVVEDSTYGIQAAKAAGLFVVARKDAYINVDQSLADRIIYQHHELFAIIEELERSEILWKK